MIAKDIGNDFSRIVRWIIGIHIDWCGTRWPSTKHCVCDTEQTDGRWEWKRELREEQLRRDREREKGIKAKLSTQCEMLLESLKSVFLRFVFRPLSLPTTRHLCFAVVPSLTFFGYLDVCVLC